MGSDVGEGPGTSGGAEAVGFANGSRRAATPPKSANCGWVSAISPSILVEQIEIEKKQKAQDRPPILTAPIASEKK